MRNLSTVCSRLKCRRQTFDIWFQIICCMTEEGGSEEVKPIRISIASGTAAGVSLLQGLLNAVRAYTPRNCKKSCCKFLFWIKSFQSAARRTRDTFWKEHFTRLEDYSQYEWFERYQACCNCITWMSWMSGILHPQLLLSSRLFRHHLTLLVLMGLPISAQISLLCFVVVFKSFC